MGGQAGDGPIASNARNDFIDSAPPTPSAGFVDFARGSRLC